MAEVTQSGGYVLLVYKDGLARKDSTTVKGVEYARNSISHTKEEIIKYGGKYFNFVEDITQADGGWKYCIFRKKY